MAAAATPPRWTVHAAGAGDDEELLALFEQVFGQALPLAQWRWKYAQAPGRGMLLRRGDTAVAFFGGMPRAVVAPDGRELIAVQNGDVMVLPSERAVFSRQGALHQVAAAFFGQRVGPSMGYEFAFGFPNERHFRLGVKLGLYDPCGRMATLTWSPLPDQPQRWLKAQPLAASQDLAVLPSLFAAMRRDWPGHFIPLRDAARWTSRFLEHPTQRYALLVLRRRWTGRPLCALVLREHDAHVEWLDYAGPASAAGLAVAAARRFAGGCGDKPLVALFIDSVAPSFAADAASCEPSDIFVPVNARPAAEHRPYRGRLWLMGGDTDFL